MADYFKNIRENLAPKSLEDAISKVTDLAESISKLAQDKRTSSSPYGINDNNTHKQNAAQTSINWGSLADSWWDLDGPMAPLHKMNPTRALYLDTRTNLQGKRLLDIGCGGGIFAQSMAARGTEVTAIDPNPQLIEVAKSQAKKTGLKINYLCTEAQDLLGDNNRDNKNKAAASLQSSPSSPEFSEGFAGSFDIVCCLEVLEHLAEPQLMVGYASSLLKDGGIGYFSTINKTAKAYALAIIAAEYLAEWLPKGTHKYNDFIKPAELCSWLESYSLQPTSIKGISYKATAVFSSGFSALLSPRLSPGLSSGSSSGLSLDSLKGGVQDRLKQGTFILSDDTDVNYLLLAKKNSPK